MDAHEPCGQAGMDTDGRLVEALQGRAWRGFSLDTKEEAAAARFVELYGRPPEFIVESHGVLLVGPAPDGDRVTGCGINHS